MGLFDYLSCEAELPEGAPVSGYQTKDTPNQFLSHYTITEDGRLLDEDGNVIDFRGEVKFSGSSGHKVWRFSAIFDGGRLLNIVPCISREAP